MTCTLNQIYEGADKILINLVAIVFCLQRPRAAQGLRSDPQDMTSKKTTKCCIIPDYLMPVIFNSSSVVHSFCSTLTANYVSINVDPTAMHNKY